MGDLNHEFKPDAFFKMCERCGGVDYGNVSTLPTDCPGVLMGQGEEERVANGLADFKGGAWVPTEGNDG
jgi:hypothetical protein